MRRLDGRPLGCLALVFAGLLACEGSTRKATTVEPPKAKTPEGPSESVETSETGGNKGQEKEQGASTDQNVTVTQDVETDGTTKTDGTGNGNGNGTESGTGTGTGTNSSTSTNTSTNTGNGADSNNNTNTNDNGSLTTAHLQRIGGWKGTTDKFPESSGIVAIDVSPLAKGD